MICLTKKENNIGNEQWILTVSSRIWSCFEMSKGVYNFKHFSKILTS